MRKLFLYLIVSSLVVSIACAKKMSAVDRWKAQFGNPDPVEGMRIAKKPLEKETGEGKKVQDAEGATTASKKDKEGEPLIPVDKITAKPTLKSVKITDNNASLQKGPGMQFEKLGAASAGDTFTLLRITPGPNKDETWYQIQNEKHDKFFVSSDHAVIIPVGERIKRSEKVSLEKIQTIFDPTPPLPKELIDAKTITLNFEQTEIYDVITTFCELLKLDYIIEGQVQGKITLQTFNNIRVEDLYSVLEQILAINNVTVVRSGNFYRFLPIKDAFTKPLSIHYGDQGNIPANDRLIIQIIPLKHVSVNSMKTIIQPLLTKNATFLDVPETKNLMLVELASNIKRIIKVVQALDIDKLAQSDIQLYKVEHSDAALMVRELNEIFSATGYKEALGNSLNFLPIERLNSVLVVNTFPDILPTIEFWIEKLDKPMTAMGRRTSTFIYFVQNGEAGRMATLLNAIFLSKPVAGDKKTLTQKDILKKTISGGISMAPPETEPRKETPTAGTPPPPPAAEAGKTETAQGGGAAPSVKVTGGLTGGLEEDLKGDLVIISDKDTNSLIIRTNPKNYPSILEILKKLDLMPQQVMIEVLIMDLTLDHSTLTGLDWAMKNLGKIKVSTGSLVTDQGQGLGGLLGASATSLFAPGVSFFVQDPTRFVALLQAFARDSKANVLANPVLVTTNNKSASIAITNEIPIVTTTATPSTSGSQISEQVQFRSVGIKLNIEPKINKDRFVNLKIEQEISSRGVDVKNQPSFNNRTLNSEVFLKDNQILVMGGLMQTTVTDSNSGIPGLKDIPFVGRIFGTDSDSVNKTELMVFITPHIISNMDEADFLTSQLKYRLTDLHPLKKEGETPGQTDKNLPKTLTVPEKPADEPLTSNEKKDKTGEEKTVASENPQNGGPEKRNGESSEPAKSKNGNPEKPGNGTAKPNGATSKK